MYYLDHSCCKCFTGMYKVCAKVNDVHIAVAPLNDTFEVQEDLLLEQVRAQQEVHPVRLCFLCSPGNPTSRYSIFVRSPVLELTTVCTG